jgi:tRNA(Leu) C34 or U34 (ribose-2'-O)-methylase TrmL
MPVQNGGRDDDSVTHRVVRYVYPGSTPRNGRVIDLGEISAAACASLDVDALLRRDGVELERWTYRVYDNDLEGWRLLMGEGIPRACWSKANAEAATRCELALEELRCRAVQTCSPSTSEVTEGEGGWDSVTAPRPGAQDGFFGIGIYNGKNENNLGTLWRTSYQLGAAYAFVVGRRFKKESSDTANTHQHIPMYTYEDWNDFRRNTPYGAVLVAVEMGGEPLETFEHPKNCVYVLGSEDTGLNTSMLHACRHHVALPATRTASYNVAVTGAILMYDREIKRRERARAAAARAATATPNRRDGIDSVKPHKVG